MTPEFGSPRTAIVTGGARRLGKVFARALAADGWTLLIHYHESAGEAEALAAEIGSGARTVQADLSSVEGPAQVIAALAGMPPAAMLVNSASRFAEDGFGTMTAASFDAHVSANVRGPALLTQAFAAAVQAGAGALVVNLLDAKLAQPNPDFYSYTLSKIALAGVTELSARVLAGRGIRVCGIAPAVTLVSGKQTREDFEAVHRMNALGRGVEADDLVAALRFIVASPRLTGQTITVDAGQRFLALPRDVQYMKQDQA
ncbi:SDR family NAD(P)-dependent oxidoreductase [Sphingomonas nostoxanthinifaciens]|nr:SDR family NAD(P)-dependent oxidoreductase [Sphingomonas nostoxanthinifaciens]